MSLNDVLLLSMEILLIIPYMAFKITSGKTNSPCVIPNNLIPKSLV